MTSASTEAYSSAYYDADYYNKDSDYFCGGSMESELCNFMQTESAKKLLIVIYTFLFVVGNISNVAMLVVSLRQWLEGAKLAKSSRPHYQGQISSSVTNALVMNLAIADIVLCVFNVTSTPFSYYYPEWPFGGFLCRFTPSALILAVCIISFTLTVMATDRHIAICYPHSRWRLNFKSTFIVVPLLWLASIGACAPIFVNTSLQEAPDYDTINGTLVVCREKWPSDNHRRIFSLCILCVQFLLPAVVIAYCYIGIFLKLRHQKQFRRQKPTAKSNAVAQQRVTEGADVSSARGATLLKNTERRLYKTTVILTAMVVIFMACWMPINILLLLYDFYEFFSLTTDLWETKWFAPTYFASHILAMTSTLWNPLLYGWLNERLRPEILKICRRKIRRTSNDIRAKLPIVGSASKANNDNHVKLNPPKQIDDTQTASKPLLPPSPNDSAPIGSKTSSPHVQHSPGLLSVNADAEEKTYSTLDCLEHSVTVSNNNDQTTAQCSLPKNHTSTTKTKILVLNGEEKL